MPISRERATELRRRGGFRYAELGRDDQSYEQYEFVAGECCIRGGMTVTGPGAGDGGSGRMGLL